MNLPVPTLPTVPHLFAWRAAVEPDSTALLIKRDGEFQPVTWSALEADVFRAIDLLDQAGVQPGDRVIHVAENRYEWIVSDLSIQSLGAIHVPLHSTLTPVQQLEQILDSEPSCLIVAQHHPETAVPPSAWRCADWPCFTYGTSAPQELGPAMTSWHASLAQARPDRGRSLRDARLSDLQASSLATILYTSGTTGEPKGVMLSQGNITSNAYGAAMVFGDELEEVRLNFLPLSHIFARTCDLYIWLLRGVRLALAESRETIIGDCHAVKPHLMNGVPYFFERIMRSLQSSGVADEPGILRDALGGNMRLCCSGGAALPDAVYDYFASQGLPLLQGYGLTESSPVISVNSPHSSQRGSVGRPIADVEVAIAADGEILTRGPHVMQGYWRKPAATEEVLRDGWLYTGDLGHVDAEGYLRITGRKKEILVTAGGKNVAPVLLESLLAQHPLIQQSMVVGDGRRFLAALLIPDESALQARIESSELPPATYQEYLQHPTVVSWFEAAAREQLQNLSHYEQVAKVYLLPRPFSIEEGELTPKLSLRRQCVTDRYAAEIESMYA